MSEKIDPRLLFLKQESPAVLSELEGTGHFALEVAAVPAPKVAVLVQFNGTLSVLESAGLTSAIVAGDVATGDIELGKVDALAALPEVVRIESSRPLLSELDVSVPEIRANAVHTGSPAYKGTGVIVGIIDSGIDFAHQCFRKADGTSRILSIWDQSLTPTGTERSPAGYTYGVEYTKANIDAALATANPSSSVRHQDSDTISGHGTHVAGIAAGDGSVAGNSKPAFTFVGVAPEADIIFVANNAGTPDLGDSASTLDAAKYIFEKAAALNKPVVINLSQGDNMGPHDGTSLLERGLDNLLGGPGRVFVKSAGNAGADNIHASGTVAAGGTERVQFTVPANDTSPETLDIWYYGPDRFGITITTPGGHTTTPVNPGAAPSPINLPNGNRLLIVSRLNDPNNHDNRIYIQLSRGTSATIQQGNWFFSLQGTTVVDGRFDAWIERGRVIASFTDAHQNNARTISIPGTSREVISVASYITKLGTIGAISDFSSRGPTRDGRQKPDIAAPGEQIMSARASGISSGSDQYHLLPGTSMATPHITGLVALILQKNKKLTNSQVKNGLMSTARSDGSTGTLPNNTWGGGKVNARAAVDFAYPAETSANWVRLRPVLANWPNGSQPPTFEISANENGTAVVELAWDPQALLAPSNNYQPLRYYSSDLNLTTTITNNDGSSRAISVPAQSIRLAGNRASWTMPQALWDGYVQEALKSQKTPPASTFRRNLYYRVRLQPTGASAALVWPADSVIKSNPSAPRLGILPLNASPSSQAIPDQAAVQAMGGIPPVLPNLWGDLLTLMWQNLPAADANRQALEKIFNHEVFRTEITDVAIRGKILKLWLFAGPGARRRLPQLLDRRVGAAGSPLKPAISQRDLKGTDTLVDNLLDLLKIVPHPDIVGVTVPEQIVDDVVTEILDPNGQMNQGQTGMSNPCCIQTLLIQVNPAEYARLQLGLLSASGTAQLANGTNVTVPPGIFQVARYAGAQSNPFFIRTNSELAFQSTILKYAQGSRFPSYNPQADPNSANGVNTVFQATVRGGLTAAEMKRALEGIFKVTFTTSAKGPSQAIRDGFITAMTGSRFPLVLSLYWGGLPSNAATGGNAVLALRQDAGRIFFKNSLYPGSSPPAGIASGSSTNNPPRRFEDPASALESIGDSDLSNWIMWYHVPDQAIG